MAPIASVGGAPEARSQSPDPTAGSSSRQNMLIDTRDIFMVLIYCSDSKVILKRAEDIPLNRQPKFCLVGEKKSHQSGKLPTKSMWGGIFSHQNVLPDLSL